MSKVVKPWNNPEGESSLSKRNHRGNNIAKANVSAIQTYRAIEPKVEVKHEMKGLYIRVKGYRA